ncbi:MAG: Xaa-Pro peptidase family protein [Phycisphaerales bacterium]
MPARGSSTRAADPHPRRVTGLRRAMSRAGVDLLLVTDPVDVAYLTGFLGGDSYLLVGPSGKPEIISDSRYEEELGHFSALRLRLRLGSILDEVASALAEAGLGAKGRKQHVGVQGEHLTLVQHVSLRTAMKKRKLAADSVRTVSNIVADLRAFKDEHEIKLLTRAIRIQQAALEATLETIDAGQTELEICAELEYQMKSRGSTDPSFATIIAAKANGSLPHYSPASVKTANNKTLLIDWGAVFAGYHGDMTRTFALGKWPKQLAEVYDVVLEAHEKAAALLAPGVRCRDVDSAARDHITAAGYGRLFGHGLGHGIGLRVHESPRLSQLAGDETLKPGHVVTIEPGVYLPGVGGVRIEDDYAITERGAKNLCTLPKTRRWATL